MLTSRLRIVLRTIQRNQDLGSRVSLRELADQCGAKSVGSVVAHINNLVLRGYLAREKPRGSLRIVKTEGERRQFFRFDPETKQLVRFVPGSSSVSKEKQRETASETDPETQKGPAFPPAP